MSTQLHHSACPILGATVGAANNKGMTNVQGCVDICTWPVPTHNGTTVGCRERHQSGVLFRLLNVCNAEWDRILLLWPSITKHLQLCLHQSAYPLWLQQSHAPVHMMLHPKLSCIQLQILLTLHTAFTVMFVLLCLRNGMLDAQVTNRRGRVELQRTVVAHKTHLQQCLADFCSLELVHGVHCPRWASLIVYLDGIALHVGVAQSKQSPALICLLCCHIVACAC